jgi:hypothetical protein
VSHADRTLTCRQCSASFTFTAGEQAFYATRGLVNEPTRCQSCRSARKDQRRRRPDYGGIRPLRPVRQLRRTHAAADAPRHLRPLRRDDRSAVRAARRAARPLLGVLRHYPGSGASAVHSPPQLTAAAATHGSYAGFEPVDDGQSEVASQAMNTTGRWHFCGLAISNVTE